MGVLISWARPPAVVVASATVSAGGAQGAAAASPAGVVEPQPAGSSSSSAGSTPEAQGRAFAASSVSGSQADAALNAFNDAFYTEQKGIGAYRATNVSTSRPTFWRSAELIEMVEDAYQRSGRPMYKRMVAQLRRGVAVRFGGNWTRLRKYNDDVMWMVIAFVRAYRITGDTTCRAVAKRNFDAAFARSWSADLGGGLWWTTDRDVKNACVNGPAAIAAYDLYTVLGDRSYLTKAKKLYGWLRNNLYDPTSGAVHDHVSLGAGGVATVDPSTYTYNQGSFIGAADALYGATHNSAYYNDALRALEYAEDDLTVDDILRTEGRGRDGGGFKGIFARYAVAFTRNHNVVVFTSLVSRERAGGAVAPERGGSHGSGLVSADDEQPALRLRLLVGGDSPAADRHALRA